ncbi:MULTISPECIES: spore germination protein [Neobacillus]|uniref:Spore germination protein n=1 Tax=Neobacillus rhizophilus TaxID=2833579 RepID=A0A942YZL5_9BACI|nr:MULTISPECIES: spore germination protein [Neobacillus]MBS4216256.1 spore germination protein [Neobacillus rhizophilus]
MKQTSDFEDKNGQPSTKDVATFDARIEYIKNSFVNTEDLLMLPVSYNSRKGFVIYIATISDSEKIQESILFPLIKFGELNAADIPYTAETQDKITLQESVKALLKGNAVVIFNGLDEIFSFNTMKEISRNLKEPDSEKTVRGSHVGFVENLSTNIGLIRKGIESRHLKINYHQIGEYTNTQIALVYIEGICNPALVKRLEERIQTLSIDMTFSPGYLEELLEDQPFSPFPHLLYTERPDRAIAQLMEGRIILLSEGSSDALALPVSFFSFFQTSDDYNTRIITGSFFRFLRVVCFLLSLLLPSLYIAVIGFHFEIIPKEILVLVKSSVENIPFPPLIEAMVMAFTIELIREAGIRLPTPIGQTIGIVGGLIIGDAIVSAGLVSNIMVIVIALTAISSFTVASYEMSNTVRILTFPIMLSAATFGFAGIIFSLMFIVGHLCKLESLGTPYFTPIAPFNLQGMKDAIIRFPIWLLKDRPRELHVKNKKRLNQPRRWEKNEK